MKTSIIRAIALACLLCSASLAQTHIVDTLKNADGTTFTGTLTISWPGFVTQAGASVAADTRRFTVTNGAIDIFLYPTERAGSATLPVRYTVTTTRTAGPIATERWGVPISSGIVDLHDVRNVTYQGSLLIPLSQLGGGSTNGCLSTTGGVVTAVTCAAGGGTWGSITGTLSAQADLTAALAAKEPTIATGITAQYIRGDKSLATFATAAQAALVGLYEVPLTFTAPINRSVNTITCGTASGSAAGCLSAADWSTFNGKQAALGFTPLNPANNLSELVSASAARTNLGLGTAATQASGAFEVPLTFSAPLSRSANTIACVVATGSVPGCLAAADWTTFNSKLSANQTITLSGDVTGSGTTAITTTIPSASVSNAKLATMADQTIKGNNAGSTGAPLDLTAAQVRTVLGLAPVATSGSASDLGTGTLPNARLVAVPNSALANSATTVNGQTCTLGSTCTITAGFTNPMTTLGDLIYEDASPTAVRLAGQITTTKKYLSQTGNGSISAVPTWAQIAAADLSGLATVGTSGLASDLTGTLADARLSANVPLLNAANAYTNTATSTSTATYTITGQGVTPTDSIILKTLDTATVGAQKVSSAIHWQGSGWKTAATAAAQLVDCREYMLPLQNTSTPNILLSTDCSINGGAYVSVASVYYGGSTVLSGINLGTGSGTRLISAGTYNGEFGFGQPTSTTFYVNGNTKFIEVNSAGAYSWTNSTATITGDSTLDTSVFRNGATGSVGIGKGSTTANGTLSLAGFTCYDPTASTGATACIAKAGAGDNVTTAKLLQIQNNGGTVVNWFSASGDMTASGFVQAGNYKSSDGTTGATTTCTVLSITSITVKNGLITGCS